jgi:hypothetical protein
MTPDCYRWGMGWTTEIETDTGGPEPRPRCIRLDNFPPTTTDIS